MDQCQWRESARLVVANPQAFAQFRKQSEAEQIASIAKLRETLIGLNDTPIQTASVPNSTTITKKMIVKSNRTELARQAEMQARVVELKEQRKALLKVNDALKDQISQFGARKKSLKRAQMQLSSLFERHPKNPPRIHLDLPLKHDNEAKLLHKRIVAMLDVIYASGKIGQVVFPDQNRPNNQTSMDNPLVYVSPDKVALLTNLRDQEVRETANLHEIDEKLRELGEKRTFMEEDLDSKKKRLEQFRIESKTIAEVDRNESEIGAVRQRVAGLEAEIQRIIRESMGVIETDATFRELATQERTLDLEMVSSESKTQALRVMVEKEEEKQEAVNRKLRLLEEELMKKELAVKICEGGLSAAFQSSKEATAKGSEKHGRNGIEKPDEKILRDGHGRIKLLLGELAQQFTEDELKQVGLTPDLMNAGWYFYDRLKFREEWKTSEGDVFENAKITVLMNEKAEMAAEIDGLEQQVSRAEKEVAVTKLQAKAKEASTLRLLHQIEQQTRGAQTLLVHLTQN